MPFLPTDWPGSQRRLPDLLAGKWRPGAVGYPLTAVRWDQLEDGHWYQVQYFERARFEYHPENQAPYNVLLGQFGRRALATRQP
jgi:hypothetical protein